MFSRANILGKQLFSLLTPCVRVPKAAKYQGKAAFLCCGSAPETPPYIGRGKLNERD